MKIADSLKERVSGARKRDPGRGKRARVGPAGSDEGASGTTEQQAGSYVRLSKAMEQYGEVPCGV